MAGFVIDHVVILVQSFYQKIKKMEVIQY